MKKILSLFLVFGFSVQAAPPTGVGSQSTTQINYSNNTIAPYRQATKLVGVSTLIETGDENMLSNPGFEGLANTVPSGWTCATGTCTKTTTSGEFSSGLAAMKVALSAQAMNVSQSQATPSGIQKQGYARVIYRVPATMADFQVCSLVDAAEQTCVPTVNLIKDDTFRSIEIPLVFGSTSAGIKFKTTSTYTANAFFDGAIVAQGLGTQNLILDNTYSAEVTTTSGTVTKENKDFIASCTAANGTVCTFNTGYFTTAPNCTAAPTNASTAYFTQIDATSSSSVTIYTYNTGGAAVASKPFTLTCQKSGNDYAASSANVYSQAGSGVHYINATATSSTFGSTNTSVPIFTITTNNNAGFLTVNSNATDGTSFVATRDLIINISGVCSAGTGGTCHISKNATTLVSSGAPGAGTSLMSGIVQQQSTAGDITIAGEFLITTGDVIRFQRNSTLGITGIGPMAITARPATNVIVGSFQGVPTISTLNTPKVIGVDVNNACAASPCTVANSFGNLTNVTRSGTGSYVLNIFGLTVAPVCSVSFLPQASSINKCSRGTVTTSTVGVNCVNTGGSPVDEGFSVTCIGQ